MTFNKTKHIKINFLPPIRRNCGIGNPYWSKADLMADICSAVKKAFPSKFNIWGAFPNLYKNNDKAWRQ